MRHIAYAGGWKKFEWAWHTLIQMKQVTRGLPLLKKALDLTLPKPPDQAKPASVIQPGYSPEI